MSPDQWVTLAGVVVPTVGTVVVAWINRGRRKKSDAASTDE